MLLQNRKASCSWRPQRWIPPTLKLLSTKFSQVAPSEPPISSPPGGALWTDLLILTHLQPSKRRWPADRWPVAPSAPSPCPAPSEPLTPRRRRGAAARAPNRPLPCLDRFLGHPGVLQVKLQGQKHTQKPSLQFDYPYGFILHKHNHIVLTKRLSVLRMLMSRSVRTSHFKWKKHKMHCTEVKRNMDYLSKR